MSRRHLSAVWADETLGPTDRLVLLCLADLATDEGVCLPSIARLSQRTGLSDRAVQSSIKRLRGAGRLSLVRGAGPQGRNLFLLHASLTPEL